MRPLSPREAKEQPVSHARWGNRTHRVLLVSSGALMAGAALSFVGDEFYWVDRVLPSWPWLIGGAVLVYAAKSHDEQRRRPGGWVAVAVLAVVATGMLGGAFAAWSFSSGMSESSTRSPDGRFAAVVTEGAAMIDPTWHVTVHQNNGLISRQWSAGCLNGDDPANEFDTLTWTSPTTLEIRTWAGKRLQVHLDRNGRPMNQVRAGTDFCP
jgi:hypothetical protein